jgi:U3 small nucleolar RNA-associated protein 15
MNSRAILRTFDGHKQPVHVARFSPLAPTQVLSCSDDTTVRLWDVPTQAPLATFTDHTDYVRAGAVAAHNPALLLSGSYDGTVRLFDTRTGACEMAMGGGAGTAFGPVEQVLMFPILRAWDLVAGGRCARALANHQKTVTALALAPGGRRLLTGSLDQMVKVYDVASYRVVHTMRYPAPVLCLAISVRAASEPITVLLIRWNTA